MNNIKVSGTSLDRRIKAKLFRNEICKLYATGDYFQKDLAVIFGVSTKQIGRYLNYDKALATARKDSAKHRAKVKATKPLAYKQKTFKAKIVHALYIDHLEKASAEFNAQKAWTDFEKSLG